LVGFEYEYLLAMNINIELESWMYAAIAAKAQDLGCTETEIVTQAIKLMLGTDESGLSRILDQLIDQKLDQKLGAKLKDLEQDLEKKLAQKLGGGTHTDRIAVPKEIGNRSQLIPTPPKPDVPIIVRPLQLGDLVQIRDQSSPHFLEKLTIIKVGMLMATVQTNLGEQSFLKRDLRFIEPSVSETLP